MLSFKNPKPLQLNLRPQKAVIMRIALANIQLKYILSVHNFCYIYMVIYEIYFKLRLAS